jgi:N-acetylmuramoyl-L-alanine amidase
MMNRKSKFAYKWLMRKCGLLLAFFILTVSVRANIEAVWSVKNKKVDLPSMKFDNIEYVTLTGLAGFLECGYAFDLRRGTGIISLKNGDLNFSLFSPYVTVGDKSYNIHHDIIYYDGGFYAPVEYLIPILDKLIPDDLLYSANKKALGLFPALYNIIDLTAQQKLNGLMIELLITEELKFDVVKTNDNWLIITVYRGKVDTARFNGLRTVKAIYDTRAYQFENSAQVSVRLRPRDFTFVSKLKTNPLRIQVMVKGEGFADTVLSYIPQPDDEMRNNPIDVIVIDPGHGGEDEGAIGPSGMMEKDLNLAISKELAKLLEDSGYYVILTRDDDRFVPLSDRTKIANEAGADIFISIHANASENKKARGFISFFLSDAKTDQARATAALENAAIKFETQERQRDYVSDLDFILLDMVQSEFLKESADLAAMIEQNVQKHSKIGSRGVDQAGFFVLNKAYMPSVLIETAFISNRDDEKLLQNKNIQKSIAGAIAESVTEFKKKYEAMR